MNKLTIKKTGDLFKNYLVESGYSTHTLIWNMRSVNYLFTYLQAKTKITDLRDVDKKTLKDFISYFDSRISERTGRPYGRRTKQMAFGVIKHMFRCLYQLEQVLVNPARDLRYKARGAAYERIVMTRKEMSVFLDSIDISLPGGLQERCIFELMYSSGLRTSEVVNLNVGDIDFTTRMLLIRKAKWDKDRVVPVSEVAATFLKRFLEGRLERKEGPVFLSRKSKSGRIHPNRINKLFKKRLKDLDMDRKGLCAHSIRHTVSVHLLAGGADIRYVQELLGHESIETTAGYTRELYDNLKRIYRSFHPRENEYYKEVDTAYLEQLERFYRRLVLQKKKTMRDRVRKKEWTRKKDAKRKKEKK